MSLKQARKEAEKKLSPVNAVKAVPFSTLTLQESVAQFFVPLALPILKSSTRKRYRSTLNPALSGTWHSATTSFIRSEVRMTPTRTRRSEFSFCWSRQRSVGLCKLTSEFFGVS
jgi:hypothetical protein